MDRINETGREKDNLIRFGRVAELDLGRAVCRVRSGEVLSDFVPWLVPRAGHVIEWSAPSLGEQVVLLSPEGDTDGAVVLRGLYSNAFPAAGSDASKHLVRYADGALIQYDQAAHALTAMLPDRATATMTANGGVTVNAEQGVTVYGPLTVNGRLAVNDDADIRGTATATTDVIGGGKSLKTHTHPGVQSGGSMTGPPQ